MAMTICSIINEHNSITAWLTSIGTIGSCAIAVLVIFCGKLKSWWQRPKLIFTLKRYSQDDEDDDVVAIEKSYGIWLEVVNTGGRCAQHCRVECEQIFDKVASKEEFTPRKVFMPITFAWKSTKDKEDVNPKRRSWCRLFDLIKLSDIPANESDSSGDDSGRKKHGKGIKPTLGYELYLAFRKGRAAANKKLRNVENTFLVPIVIQYENPMKYAKRYVRIHWKAGETNIDDTTLTYELLTEDDIRKKKMIVAGKGGPK